VNNGIVEVFVDGVKRIEADVKFTADYGPYSPSIVFGQVTRQWMPSGHSYVEGWWQSVKYATF
jgi:hypothetical protein